MKKRHSFLAILLVLCMTLSALPLGFAAAAEAPAVWDGQPAQAFAGGSGTMQQPYLIENGGQLYKAINDLGQTNGAMTYYKITADIYLNENYQDYANWDTTAPKNVWLNATQDFIGFLDGDGHTIYGLYVYREGWQAGLIARLHNGATISNLNISNAYVKDLQSTAGAIAGTIYNGTVTRCTVHDSIVDSTGANGAAIVGNVADKTTERSTISCCASWNTTVKTTSTPTGILATSDTNQCAKLTDCYSAGNVPTNERAKCTNVYTDTNFTHDGVTVIANDQMQGEGAVERMNLPANYWKDTDTYPVPVKFKEVKGQVWTGVAADTFAGGEGTEASPYLIETGSQLYKAVNDLGKKADGTPAYYLVTEDIILNDNYEEYAGWEPLVNYDQRGSEVPANNWDPTVKSSTTNYGFIGHIDGGFHTVYGLYAATKNWRNGLIPYMNGDASVSNLTVAYACVYNDDNTAGVITGQMYGNAKIDRCIVHDAVVTLWNLYVGGIAGVSSTPTAVISNCGTYNLKLQTNNSLSKYEGGILGKASGGGSACTTLRECYSIDHYPIGTDMNSLWCRNCYTNAQGAYKYGITILPTEQVKGTAAAEAMRYLDFITVWEAHEDGYPTLRTEGGDNLKQEITASYPVSGEESAVQFVSKVVMPTISPSFSTNIVITKGGEKKTVSEVGMIISREGTKITDITAVKNDPLTGYITTGYTNGGDNSNVVIEGGYITLSATVKGGAKYTAQSYIKFADGEVVIGDAYTSDPSGDPVEAGAVTFDDKYALGDADFNGTINIIDLIRIKKYSLEADFDGSTILDIIDLDESVSFGATDVTALRKMLIESAA